MNDITGGFNRDRRPTLVLPGELGSEDMDEEEDNELRRAVSNLSNRRVSHAGRRGSTIFNFDANALPNVENVNLNAQPRKSAMRRPSMIDMNNDLCIPAT